MNVEWEVQKAIFNALDNGLTVPVYDFVPQQNAPDTYVTIGEDTFNAMNTDGNIGFDSSLVIHTWDVSNGRKDTKLLQWEIRQLLDRAEIPLTGYNPLGIDCESSQTILDPDGVTYHGILRFRFQIMES